MGLKREGRFRVFEVYCPECKSFVDIIKRVVRLRCQKTHCRTWFDVEDKHLVECRDESHKR